MIRRRSFLKGLLAAVPLGAAVVITRKGPARPDPHSNPEAFRLDLERFDRVDPALMGYSEGSPIAEGLVGASGMLLSSDGTPYISIGNHIWRLVKEGLETVIEVPGKVTAMAVTGHGSLLLAAGQTLSIYNSAGRLNVEPVHFGERAFVTSIALQGGKLFAADAGQRTVWVLSGDGKLTGSIDGRSEATKEPGFVVPSPWFSMTAGTRELWVTNPGRQRVQRYVDGQLTGSWGFASMDVAGFCGCCNPTHLALLPDGGFVTSEKGIPRVKVYDRDGAFLSVVAGADDFENGTTGLAVAAAPDGRILVLDPVRGQLRSFTPLAQEVKA
jgi:hypothetical protein